MRVKEIGFLACLVCLWGTMIGSTILANLFPVAAIVTLFAIILTTRNNKDDET